MMDTQGQVIGIDLGTTFSAMARLDRGGRPVTLPNAEGELTTASVVLFDPDGSVVVGREARRESVVCPDRVADCVKRDMGQPRYHRPVAGKQLAPPSIAAMILRKLRQDAEQQLGCAVSGAVITVPAYFDETRRQATVDAGRIAGLEVLDIINEPTSAALAYAFRRILAEAGGGDPGAEAVARDDRTRRAMVYDLGGGTFDVTIIEMTGADVRVLATDGAVRLGGKDWDERIVNHAAELFLAEHGEDPRDDPQSHQDLLLAAEETKKDLSRRETARLAVNHAGRRLGIEVTRAQFEEMTRDLLYRTESRVDRAGRQAHLAWGDLDEVLLVGGSTRMPQVRQMLRTVTGHEPNASLSADEVVAHGAAIHAAILQVDPRRLAMAAAPVLLELDEDDPPPDKDVITLPAGSDEPVEPGPPPVAGAVADAGAGTGAGADDDAGAPDQAGEPILLESAPPLPGAADEAGTDDEEIETFVFDDEGDVEQGAPPLPPAPPVAEGFQPEVRQVLQQFHTVNVNAHSLGVIVWSPSRGAEQVNVLIPRNTPLPASQRRTYGTVSDNQRLVRVRVTEGESDDPGACVLIGECIVTPLPPGLPMGSPISVTFTYDNSGRLHVRAKDDTSGLTAKCTIVRSGAMDEQTLDRNRQALSDIQVS